MEFRQNGQDYKTIIQKLEHMRNLDAEAYTGEEGNKITGCIYVNDYEVQNVATEAMSKDFLILIL